MRTKYVKIIIYSCLALPILAVSTVVLAEGQATKDIVETAVEDGLVDPKVVEVIKSLHKHMQALSQFKAKAYTSTDIISDDGQKLEFHDEIDVSLKRPNMFKTDISGDTRNALVNYNGKTFTVYDKNKNMYGSFEKEGSLENVLEYGVQKYNLQAPLAEFIYHNSADILLNNIIEARYEGLSQVDGQACHHISVRQDEIDWQIWIQSGDKPFPKKVNITEKTLVGYPQYSVVFSQWQSNPNLADNYFEPNLPEDSEKIEFLGANQ